MGVRANGVTETDLLFRRLGRLVRADALEKNKLVTGIIVMRTADVSQRHFEFISYPPNGFEFSFGLERDNGCHSGSF